MSIELRYEDELKERAVKALDKKATYGEDIDLSIFEEPDESETVDELSKLPREIQEAAIASGIDPTEANRSGSFMQLDHTVIYRNIQKAYGDKLEIMDINDAMAKYPEIREKYWWRAAKVDQDKYTAFSELHSAHGYFIRVFAGQKVDKPIQSCLMLQENARVQNVHNIIVVEEGADAQVITGCSLAPKVENGLHLGISEFFVEKDAKLTFTMIHNWAPEFHVRPRSAAVVGDNGVFINNYVLLKPVRSIQSFPSARLVGKNSVAAFNSLLYGLEDSSIDVGSRIILEGEGSSGQAISRAIVNDSSKIYARGALESKQDDSRAHLDCRGILMSPYGMMYAVPELLSEATGSYLSHEAAIGPIAEEEVEYLMSRGLTKDEAISLITRGFMDVKILGLPKMLEDYISEMIEATQKESM
ncbi:SufD family Fe-S cluster assembly protein [Mahella sp.]|uniref:SufB/SufD family protein n=1 Tax=Mahella sp. TaxID=2798721 RepID=UPI0025B7D4EB|nr:SufD family Fe-S cluster assembly protein [Mahella sp.]MBZ4665883.1 SufBD protein [Mahella sp.]